MALRAVSHVASGARVVDDDRRPLEFHHVEPCAAGGDAVADNIQLRCRARNAHEVRLSLGAERRGVTPVARERTP